VFIDNGHTFQDAFARLLETGGDAPILMIGHPYPGTIKALREAIPIMKARGIQLVTASALVRESAARRNAVSSMPSGRP
jgi:polysaccharide deacetylase 2 family uncharacterized protein YibQ